MDTVFVEAAAAAVEADGDDVVAAAAASGNGSEAAEVAGQSRECALLGCWERTAALDHKEGSSLLVHHWAWLGPSVLSDAGSPLSAHHSGLTNKNVDIFIFLQCVRNKNTK